MSTIQTINSTDQLESTSRTKINDNFSALNTDKQETSSKDATGGYVGLTLFKINFKNVANTFTSFFTNTNTASRTYTFPDVTGTVVLRNTTDTLLNKRITKRVGTTTSSATPTINTDNYDQYYLTAQTADITSFTTNLSGTPVNGDLLFISITGTASRAITWGASFENGSATLPTTTSGTTTLDVLFRWNSATSKWRCMAQG